MRYRRSFHVDWPYLIPGDEHGEVEYAITREEWEADRSFPLSRPDQSLR
jgi:hypothetical protein